MSSDRPDPTTPRRRRDRGMTLPEVIISIAVTGILATTLAFAASISLRQTNNSEARLNVARAEQSIDTWLPADLSSTDVSDTTLPAVELDPAATPCGNCSAVDLSGANALQLAWKTLVPGSPPGEIITRVQYQYVQRGDEWLIERIECEGSSPCTSIAVIHDLDAPPDLSAYDPNTDRPVWVMDVSVPVVDPSLDLNDSARKVVVTVDGGGENAGAGGGLNTISLTAGGRTSSEIEADEFTVPSFVRAKSRCGGPVTLIVDDSGSIGSAVSTVVEPGVKAFIEAFRGTPTQVQVVKFSTQASAIGGGGAWHHYVDMTDDTAINALKSSVTAELVASGGTNWEEAFFHTLRDQNGDPAATTPNRIVFFTDGIPTVHRRTADNYFGGGRDFSNGPVIDFNDGEYPNGSPYFWPNEHGTNFHQESWDRADVILDTKRDIDLIGVGVGSGLQGDISWIHNPAVYTNRNSYPSTAATWKAYDTISYLLHPGGHVLANYDGTEYTNPETADFYLQTNFDASAFAAAMRAAALKDCGGTLTIQTRLPDGTPVGDEFVYENVEYRDDDGTPIAADPRRVTTSSVFRTGTFDFEIASGSDYYSVDVVLQELETLSGYSPGSSGWSCRAGGTTKTTTPIPITDSSFEGITVDIAANEAVSCILTVTTGGGP